MNFNVAYFPHFDLAHFEIEESFELVWVKLQNDRFRLQVSILRI